MKQDHRDPGNPVKTVALGAFFAQARARTGSLQQLCRLAHRLSPIRMVRMPDFTIPRARQSLCNTCVIPSEATGYESSIYDHACRNPWAANETRPTSDRIEGDSAYLAQ